jgi:prophage tail gpP-like protein
MNDDVRIVIDGKEFTGWEAATITMAIGQIADAFSIDGPWDWNKSELRTALRPFGYQRVELYIGNDICLTGRMEKPKPSLSATDRKINIQGRSLTGPLAECSIDGDLEFSGLTLAAVARRVCSPFGISVRADNDTPAIPEARAEYGQVAGDFLNSMAASRNMLLNCSYKGELVIASGAALSGKVPVADLVEGEGMVLSVDPDFDGTKRFSKYGVATQFAGVPDIQGSRTDPSIPVYRPHLEAAGETDTDPGATAARLRVKAIVESCIIAVSVIGWRRPDGKLWAERQAVTLLAPSAMIYKKVPWIISQAQFKLDGSSGRITTLNLVLPDTYSGNMPKEIPWAS